MRSWRLQPRERLHVVEPGQFAEPWRVFAKSGRKPRARVAQKSFLNLRDAIGEGLAFDFGRDDLTAVFHHVQRSLNDLWPSAALPDGSDAPVGVDEALNFAGVLRDRVRVFLAGGYRQNFLLHMEEIFRNRHSTGDRSA